MNIISGIIKNLNKTTSVSRTENSITTSHIAAFKINGQPITVDNTRELHFLENDEVLLAVGAPKGGVYDAYAYHNITHNIFWINYTSDVLLAILGLFVSFIFSQLLIFIGSWIVAAIITPIFIYYIIRIVKKRIGIIQTLKKKLQVN